MQGAWEERQEGEESGDAMTYLVGIPQCDWQDQLLYLLCNVVGLEELGLHPQCCSIS